MNTLTDKVRNFGNKALMVAYAPSLMALGIANEENFVYNSLIFTAGYASLAAALNLGTVISKLVFDADDAEWDANSLRNTNNSIISCLNGTSFKPLYPGDPRVEASGMYLGTNTDGTAKVNSTYRLTQEAIDAAWGRGDGLLSKERYIISQLSEEERGKIPPYALQLVGYSTE